MIGFAVPFAITGNLPFSIVSSVAAVFPDAVEGRQDAKIMMHRGLSHHPLVWLAACGGLGLLAHALRWHITGVGLDHGLPISPKMSMQLVEAFSVGIATHLATDAITMTGVPVSLDCKKRFALRLFPTGAFVESVICWLFLILSLLIRFQTILDLIQSFAP